MMYYVYVIKFKLYSEVEDEDWIEVYSSWESAHEKFKRLISNHKVQDDEKEHYNEYLDEDEYENCKYKITSNHTNYKLELALEREVLNT